MLLTQKASHVPTVSPTHRRHPSAPPSVIVQPTRTPGLLSLSKPSKPSPPRQKVQRAPKGSKTESHHHEAIVEEKSASTKPTSVSASPEKVSRGRQSALKAPKDKNRRSASVSQSRAQARRAPHHQPSPPAPYISTPSPAEAINKKSSRRNISSSRSQSFAPRNPESNSFDPFLSSASDKSDNESFGMGPNPIVVRTAPKLTARPTGKLARRRQPESPTPVVASARPIPVPRRAESLQLTGAQVSMLSRSDPAVPSHMPVRPVARRCATAAPTATLVKEAFPVCDDLTDTEEDSPLPRTPPRDARSATWQQNLLAFEDGPRTAPLTSDGFNFSTPPRRPRYHQRMPSEGVFNLPMDEELSDDAMFYGLSPAAKAVAAYNKFASSQFQNSPAPDALPAPRF